MLLPGLSRSISSRSSLYTSLGDGDVNIGDRVIVAGQRKGVVCFSGHTDFAPGECPRMQHWGGIDLGGHDIRLSSNTIFPTSS